MTGQGPQVPAGWEGILAPGERILWQGRPDGRLTFRGHSLGLMFMGAVFSAVALLFMGIGIVAGDLVFTLFPVIHLSVGLGLMFGMPVYGAYARRRTWYTLTDRRAVIATDYWPKGRDITLHEIGPDSPVTLVERPWPGVQFATHHLRTKNGTRILPIGFERIAEARLVHDILHSIKQGKA